MLKPAGTGYARLNSYRALLKSQEAERTRIAKQLHDDIGQSLTLLGIELELSRSAVSAQSPAAAAQLQKICGRVTELGHAVSLLAHKLHSSELELLGLGAAIRGMAAEFSKSNRMQVNCDCAAVSATLRGDVSLNFFRIAQDALENICKRHHATTVDILLRADDNSVSLTISDDGAAFPLTDEDKETVEMAIANINERISLAGGHFSIDLTSDGMRMHATAPLSSAKDRAPLLPIAI